MNHFFKKIYTGVFILCLCSCVSPWPQELNGTTLEPINKPEMVADIKELK